MRKFLAIVMWVFRFVFVGLFSAITALFMYPIYNLTKWKLLWWWGDDSKIKEDGSYKQDYLVFIDNNGKGKETYWVKYKWHAIRNSAWNFKTITRPKADERNDLEFSIDNLTLNGVKVQDGGKWEQIAGIKYVVKDGRDPWQGWTGTVISHKYSIFGESLMWFKSQGKQYFNYSYCKYREFTAIKFRKKLVFLELYKWKGYRTLKCHPGGISFKYQIDLSKY